MTPKQVRRYYDNSCAKFHKRTGMSTGSLQNWLRWGFVPMLSQRKLEKLTNGELAADWKHSNDK